MCDPVSITVGILAVTGGMLQKRAQERQFRQQEENEKSRHKVEKVRAERDAIQKTTILRQQSDESQTQANLERQRLALEGLQDRANQRATSSGRSIGGISPLRSFIASNIQEAEQESILSQNERNDRVRLGLEQRSVGFSFQDRIQNSAISVGNASRRKVRGIDYLASGLGGASSGLQTASNRGSV